MNNQLRTLLGSSMFTDLMRQDAENKREQRQSLMADLNDINSEMTALVHEKTLISANAAVKEAEKALKLAREHQSLTAVGNLNKRNALIKRQKILSSKIIELTPNCLVNLREKLTERFRGTFLRDNEHNRIKKVYDSITSLAMTVTDTDLLFSELDKLEVQSEAKLTP